MDAIVTDQRKLKVISIATSREEAKTLKLAERLKAACEKAWTKGCGLAAVQIGVPLRFGWYRFGGKDKTLINPFILEYKGGFVKKREGCLSIPDNWAWVNRSEKIVYMNDGHKMKATGDEAHIIQHEVDHMMGILNIDRG